MNTAEIEIGGAKRIISFPNKPDSVKYTSIIYGEIFKAEHYKEGLKHIKKIKKPVVLDLGANIGISVLYFNQRKDCQFYAVEPENEYFKALEINVKGLNCTNYHLAIGGANLTRYLSGMSLYFEGEQLAQATPTKTLEMFFKENKIKHIDLLKIDVEGAEYEIFSTPSFREVADKINFIIGEGHYKPYPCRPDSIEYLLKPYGFEVKYLKIKNFVTEWALKLMDNSGNEIIGKIRYSNPTMFTAERKT